MELIFLGTSAGVPTRSRNVTAILLDLKHPTRGGLWLFDCGEGTQHQLLHTSYHPGKVDKIFITHLHGDHLFGLPGPALRVKLVHGLVNFPLDHQLRGLGGPLCRFFHGLLFLLGEP